MASLKNFMSCAECRCLLSSSELASSFKVSSYCVDGNVSVLKIGTVPVETATFSRAKGINQRYVFPSKLSPK